MHLPEVGLVQVKLQLPVVQMGVPEPTGGPGQLTQPEPQAVASLFALHSLPHLWKPF